MVLIRIITLLILFFASLGLLYWVFRPGSKRKYDEYSKIPLKSDPSTLKDVTHSSKDKEKKDGRK